MNNTEYGKIIEFDSSRQMRLRIILNPFFVFSIIWIIVPLVHLMNLTMVYPGMDLKTGLFLAIIVVCSIILAVVYDRKFLKNRKFVFFENSSPSYWLIILLLLATSLECLYSGQIPLLNIRNDMSSYKDFGIPTLSFAISSFFFAYDAVTSVKLVYGKKEDRFGNLVILFFVWFRFLLTYSRGGLITCALITFFVWLSTMKMSVKLVIFFLFAAVVGLLGFNALGNIRMNSAWNDSSEIIKIAQIRPEYEFLSSFSWGLVYIDTPLGNLLYNIQNVPTEKSFVGLVCQLLPDFLSKRVWPQYNSELVLPIPNLIVSSMFAGGYKYGGYVGMFLSYFELCIVIFFFAFATKNHFKEFIAMSSSLTVIALMTFFDNTISVSGSSFYIFFIAMWMFFDKQSIDPDMVQKLALIFRFRVLETIDD